MELGLVSHRTRSYQQEMFERSMSGNTVVVVCRVMFEPCNVCCTCADIFQMDTGSGKTQVYVIID